VTVDRLDDEVAAQFFEHLDAFHVQAVDTGELAAAQADVDTLAGEVERLAAVVPSHPRAIAAHQEALTAAESILADAEDRRDHLVASAAKNGPDSRELRGDWPDLTVAERREILRAGIDAVVVRRASRRTAHLPVADRVRVVFNGDAPDGLVDNGRAGTITGRTWDDDPGSLVAAA
jgi:hypothetical protein